MTNRPVEYAVRYGYGISVDPPRLPATTDPNREAITAMAARERQRFEAERHSCTDSAGLGGRYGTWLTEWRRARDAMASDASVLSATRRWSACMGEETGNRFHRLEDADAAVSARLEDVANAGATTEAPLEAVQEFERALARADASCRTEAGVGAAFRAARERLEGPMLARFAPEIERLRADIEAST